MRTVLSSDAEQSDKESDAHATSEIPCECPSIVLSCLPSKAFQILMVLSEATQVRVKMVSESGPIFTTYYRAYLVEVLLHPRK